MGEWETTSLGIGITCTPMGIYSHGFYAAVSLYQVLVGPLARCAEFTDYRCLMYSGPRVRVCTYR